MFNDLQVSGSDGTEFEHHGADLESYDIHLDRQRPFTQ